MDLVSRCQELNLSFNSICRIENISPLRQLRVLNLAENRIRSIEGLEQLKLLEFLDLSGNQISSIPASLGANQNLLHLRLSRNKLISVCLFSTFLVLLSSLSSLTIFTIYRQLPIYRNWMSMRIHA